MARTIDYANLMQRALREQMRTVLQDVAENGLPGAHHFYITFDTTHPDVAIADWLKSRYPSEMIVVIQHQFRDLAVTDKGFSVTLEFGNRPETLVIPFEAVLSFMDPSAQYGFRFKAEGSSDDEEEDESHDEDDGDDDPPPARDAQVVSLDKFRKH